MGCFALVMRFSTNLFDIVFGGSYNFLLVLKSFSFSAVFGSKVDKKITVTRYMGVQRSLVWQF